MQTTDGIQYAQNADSLLAGNGYRTFYWCPGYSIYLAGCKILFGEMYQYGCVVGQYLFLLGAAFLTWKMLSGRGSLGIIAFVLIMLSPHLLNQAGKLRPEILCLACVSPAFYVLAKRPANLASLAWAALFMGLATHVRNTSLGIVAGVVVWLLVCELQSLPILVRLRLVCIFVCLFLFTLVPWSLYASCRVGQPVLIAQNMKSNFRGGMTWGEHNRHSAPEANQKNQLTREGIPQVPLSYLNARFQSLRVLWSPLPLPRGASASKWFALTASMWWTTPGFCIAAWLGLVRRKADRVLAMCVIVSFLYTVALAMVYVRVRYRFPVDPLIYVAALQGWAAVAAWKYGKPNT